MGFATKWTAERVDLLRKLAGEGLTAAGIAAEMGGNVTRQTIIGAMHRYNIPSQSGQGTHAGPRRKSKLQLAPFAPMVRALVPRPAARLAYPVATKPVARVLPSYVRPAKLLTVLNLTDATCRWPIGTVGTPDFGFCGCTSRGGFPYCEYHSLLSYPALAPSTGSLAAYNAESAS